MHFHADFEITQMRIQEESETLKTNLLWAQSLLSDDICYCLNQKFDLFQLVFKIIMFNSWWKTTSPMMQCNFIQEIPPIRESPKDVISSAHSEKRCEMTSWCTLKILKYLCIFFSKPKYIASINIINNFKSIVLYFTIIFNPIVIRNASWDCSSYFLSGFQMFFVFFFA